MFTLVRGSTICHRARCHPRRHWRRFAVLCDHVGRLLSPMLCPPLLSGGVLASSPRRSPTGTGRHWRTQEVSACRSTLSYWCTRGLDKEGRRPASKHAPSVSLNVSLNELRIASADVEHVVISGPREGTRPYKVAERAAQPFECGALPCMGLAHSHCPHSTTRHEVRILLRVHREPSLLVDATREAC